MKTNRYQQSYRSNASSLHKQVGDLLRSKEMFANYQVYQEYPVNKVYTLYPEGSHKFDWVVLGLNLVIECHGKQHYQVQNFGMNDEQAIEAFKGIQKRDAQKQQAAEKAGFKYLVISYKIQKDLTVEKLWDLIRKIPTPEPVEVVSLFSEKKQINNQIMKDKQKQTRQEYLQSDEHQAKLKQARELRREQYLRNKETKRSYIKDPKEEENDDVYE